MTEVKPNLSNLRLVVFPPRTVEPPPAPSRDYGAYFVQELDRLLAEVRAAGLSDAILRTLIEAFVPDFPEPQPRRKR